MTHLYKQRGQPHDSYQFFRLEASGYKIIQVVLPVGPSGTTYRILFEVTIFQHSPLTRRVFYINNNKSRNGGHHQHQQGNTSINHWKIFNIMQSSYSIFNLHHQQHLQYLINNIFRILIFQLATTSSALGPFDQQHLQHFDVRSETTSSAF